MRPSFLRLANDCILKDRLRELKKIYINGRFLTQRITGAQRYSLEILRAIDHLVALDDVGDFSFEVLAPQRLVQDARLSHIKVRNVGYFGGQIWEQIELPYFAHNGFLLNFCNNAPVIKKNQIVTIHDAAVYSFPTMVRPLFRYWYRILHHLLAWRVQDFITVSKYSACELNKYYHIPLKNLHVIYNAVDHMDRLVPDETIFEKKNINRGNYVLALSTLSPSKNFQLIVKTAKLSSMHNVQFLFAGGQSRQIMRKLDWEISDLPRNIQFLGYVSDEQLLALYRNAGCFVYPSFYEGFGIPPIEAMRCGCPVIVSKCASLPEVCRGAAIYCDPYDCEELSKNILSLLRNNILRDKLRVDGVKFSHEYSWEESAKQVIELLKSCFRKNN